MTSIELPVSIGEALDKLSILEIKNEIIGNEHVRKEYLLLKDLLVSYIDPVLYPYLVHINRVIWGQMDELREQRGTSMDERGTSMDDRRGGTSMDLKVYQDCIDTNDIRFKIKNKINLKSQSSLREQKSYGQTSIRGGSEDPVEILLYSFIYDRVLVYTRHESVRKYFADDPTIEFTDIPMKPFPRDDRLEFFNF